MSQCNRCLSNPCRCEGINAWSEIRAEQPRPALKEFRTALNALYLEVEPSIANDIVKLATAAIAEAESESALPALGQDGWISVKEKLPEKDQQVLVNMLDDNSTHGGEREEYMDVWIYTPGHRYFPGEPDHTITHWQPLPQPPKAVLSEPEK